LTTTCTMLKICLRETLWAQFSNTLMKNYLAFNTFEKEGVLYLKKGIEITLPFVEYESYFQLTNKQIVNVSSLALHMNDPNYNAKDAILQ